MEAVKLQIKRKRAFVAAAMSYKIMIDGQEQCRLRNGNTQTILIPNRQCVMEVNMVGNSMNFHKISKEIVLFPSNSQTDQITCEIETSLNWVGFFTLGIFAPVGMINIKVMY